jgi:hypothetical protein
MQGCLPEAFRKAIVLNAPVAYGRGVYDMDRLAALEPPAPASAREIGARRDGRRHLDASMAAGWRKA